MKCNRCYLDVSMLRQGLAGTCWETNLADFLEECLVEQTNSSIKERVMLYKTLQENAASSYDSNKAKERLYRIMLPIIFLAIIRTFEDVSGEEMEVILQDGLVELSVYLNSAANSPYESFVAKCYRIPVVLQKRMTEKESEDERTIGIPMCGCIYTGSDAEKVAINNEFLQALGYSLYTLTPREEFVVRSLYGLDNGSLAKKEYSRSEVANYLGIDKATLYRVEKKAFRKLRHPSRSRRLIEYY